MFPPGPIITAPQPGLTRYGLFRVAAGPLDMPRHGATGGVRFVPDGCGESFALPIDCPDESEHPEPDGVEELISTGVFAVRAALECSAVGLTEAEARAHVLRRLEASEQATVEHSFATGLGWDDQELSILSLDAAAGEVEASYDPTDLRSAVGALLGQAATDYGFTPVVHAPAGVEGYATDLGLVLQDGPYLRLPSGARWSFGAYPPGELFISGAVTIWRTPLPEVVSTFENGTNLRLVTAERSYSVGIDCGWAARADFNPLGS